MSLTQAIRLPIIASLIVWLLIGLGVFLRSYQADLYPVDNNDDGLFYTWAGISFLSDPASPITHSIFDNNNQALFWRSQYHDYDPVGRFGFKMVKPWFDHPPLGAAVIAFPAWLLGYRNYEEIPGFLVRFPALIASIFTLLCTYLLARKLFSHKTALLSLVIIATVPYFIIAHRQSFLENIQTPIFLASLLTLTAYFKTKQIKFIIITAVLAFLCGWIKAPGFAVPFMIAGWLIYKREYKQAVLLTITGITSILSFVVYGFAINKEVFLATLFMQGGRGATPTSLYYGVVQPKFYDFFHDGWYLLSFITSLWILFRPNTENKKFFAWFFVCWLLVLFILAGNFNSPWYRYPLIPFLSISLGYVIHQVIRKPSIYAIAPFFLLGLTGFDLLHIEVPSLLLRIGTIAIFIPYVLTAVTTSPALRRITTWLTMVIFFLFVSFNVYVSYNFPQNYCQHNRCLEPDKINNNP